MLQSNFASLGRTIGSLFIPILQTVLPYINAIVIAIQRMFAYIAKLLGIKLSNFVSSTGGISTDTSNIADDMDNASDSIGTANKNAKKLKKTLSVLSFDELNQLNDKTSNPSSGSGKGGLGHIKALDAALDDALSAYQKAWDEAFKKMSNRANEMADAIVNAFKRKDWKGLGKIMADGINWGMQKLYDFINWNNVGPHITKFTSAFTQTFNSLVDNINWDLMGRTVGAGINTIVNTANQLLEGTNFKNLGKKFAEGIMGLSREVDWTNLGNSIGNNFMKSWHIFYGFVSNLKYDEIGIDIGNALNGVFEKINFTEIASALTTGINGAFTALASFTATFNWDDFTKNLGDGISKFISDMHWKENGKALGDFLSHLCDALTDALTPNTFRKLGEGIGDFIGQLPWEKLLATAAKLLISGFGEAMSGLWESGLSGKITAGLTTAFVAVKIADITGISTLVGSLVGHIASKIAEKKNAEMIAEKLADVLGDGTSGAKEAIKDLGDAAESAGNGGFTTLAEKIKNLGDVAQTAGGQFQGFWGYATNLGATAFVMEGLWQVKKAMDFKDSTADAFNDFEVVRKALKIIEDQTGVSGDKLIGLGGDLKNVKDNAFDFDGQLQTVETSLENLGISSDTFKQALKQAMEESDTSTNSHVSNINEYIGTMGTEFDNAKSALERLSNQAVITPTQFDELSAVLQQQESSGATARAAFQALMDKMTEMGIDTGKVIKAFSEDVPKSSSTMSKSVETATKSISSNSKTGFGIASAAVSTAMAGMKKSTESTMPSIWSKIKNTNDDVETNSKTNWGNSASAVSTALGTMDTDTKDIMGKVMTTIQSYWSSVLINTNQIWEKASGKVDTETGKMKTYTESNLSGISDKIKRLFNVNLTSIGRETAQSFADGMKQVHLPTLTYYISEWRKHDLGGGRTSSTPVYKPNWYAKGGLFNGAQVIGIGENGSEAVLPLENPRTMKKIADSIVSSSDGSMGLTKEEMTKAVAQGVAMAMSMNSGNKNPQYIMNSIILDGSEIAKAVTKAQNDTDSRFKPSPAY